MNLSIVLPGEEAFWNNNKSTYFGDSTVSLKTKLIITPSSYTFASPGETVQFHSNNSVATWTVADDTIAGITSQGSTAATLIALKYGNTTLTVTDEDNNSETVEIIVEKSYICSSDNTKSVWAYLSAVDGNPKVQAYD